MTESRLARIVLALAVFAVLAPLLADGLHLGVEIEGDHDYYRSTGFSSLRIWYRGDIQLSPDVSRIEHLSPDAHLVIERRRFFTTRHLDVSSGPGGEPVCRLFVGERERSRSEAEAFLARHLPDAARWTPIGAQAQARRVLQGSGPEALLAELRRLDNDEAREVYFDVLLEGPPPPTPAVLGDAARTAGDEVESSSRLSRVLSRIAVLFPQDPELTRRVVRACARIESSRKGADTLLEIARARGIRAADASDYAAAASRIDSSSEKARAVARLAGMASEPAVADGLLSAAKSIASSSEMRRALAALLSVPGVPPPDQARIVRAADAIASSSERASLLAESAPELSAADEVVDAYAEAAERIASSSESARALEAMLRRRGLSDAGAARLLRAASEIDSSSEKAALLARSAADLPVSDPVVSAYFGCADTIGTSSGKREALMSLLDRADLPPSAASAALSFARRRIERSSDREAVTERARRRLAGASATGAAGPVSPE
jgi:hypothetical protein